MDSYVNKYKKMIEDELFKATPDEAIEFCWKLENYLESYIDQMEKEKAQYGKETD